MPACGHYSIIESPLVHKFHGVTACNVVLFAKADALPISKAFGFMSVFVAFVAWS